MPTDTALADLHCHSTISDGSLRPEAVAQRAADRGVQIWSLTDHDEIGGQAVAQATAQALGMRYLAGVEISVTWANKTLHMVGLGIDYQNPKLIDGLAKTRSGRAERAKEMSDKFAALGFPNVFEGVLPYVGNPELISRTHFGRYLSETYPEKFKNIQAVFDQYLHDDGLAYVPMKWASLADAVDWIISAGGIAVIAHPGRYDYDATQFDALFSNFKDLGGRAIEVVTGSHFPAQYTQYANIAKRYGFLASCGSDFHCPTESHHDLGSMPSLPMDLDPVWRHLA